MQTDLGWLVERIIEKAKETMKKNAPESAAHLRAKFEYTLAFYASAGPRVSLSPTTAFCLSYRAVTKQTARRPSEGFFRPSSGITASVRQILPPLLTR